MSDSKTILIIEDEDVIADLEKDYLELSGFVVEIINNGTDGVKQALETDPCLVISDIMLPGLDGFEVCKAIRAEKQIPIIMVSAKKDEVDKIKSLGLGADDYLTKPFSPSELVARVKAHIGRYERLQQNTSSASDVLSINGLQIDKQSRRVFVNGDEKILTNKEYELLVFLAENPNHVFTKEELFHKIWKMESIGDIATVTVHVKKLREKLGDDSNKPQYIETIWGVGYRFKA